MPTKREREYYAMGYEDGRASASLRRGYRGSLERERELPPPFAPTKAERGKPKRKLSAWNKFVKANSKKPRFRLRSGSPNLKKLGVAFRKTPAGRKKRR